MTNEALKIDDDNGVLSAAGEAKMADTLGELTAERDRLEARETVLLAQIESFRAKMADDEKKRTDLGKVLARLVEPELDLDDDISASVSSNLADALDYDDIAAEVASRVQDHEEFAEAASDGLDYDDLASEIANRLEVTITTR